MSFVPGVAGGLLREIEREDRRGLRIGGVEHSAGPDRERSDRLQLRTDSAGDLLAGRRVRGRGGNGER